MEISALIITKQEEKKLRDCLASLDFVQEIIVVDSGSTDNTTSIAKEYGASVFFNPFKDFASQRNFCLSKATHEWVLFIDADERVDSELKEAIKSALANSGTQVDGYYLNRINHIFGGPLRYGASGKDKTLRLFKKSKGTYQGLVHEQVALQGSYGVLPGCLVHITYQTLHEYFLKFNLYTSLDAENFVQKRHFCPPIILGLLLALWQFIYYFIIKLGFLDGYRGFQFQAVSSFYTVVKFMKIHEITRN